MSRLGVAVARLRSWLGRRTHEADFDQELDAHLSMLTDEFIRQGLSPVAATRAAKLRLGGVAQLKETHREGRGFPAIEQLLQDARYAARLLRKTPAFTAGAILTIALGIGANTGLYSVVNGFFRPLPVRNPSAIVVLAATSTRETSTIQYTSSYFDIVAFREHPDVFADVFGFGAAVAGLKVNSTVNQFFFSRVTGNFFTALGVKPALGRVFRPGEGEYASADLEVILGHTFWEKHCGADPNIVGRLVQLDGHTATVIGVVPKEFFGLFTGVEMDGYVPLSWTAPDIPPPNNIFKERGVRSLTMVARLAPRTTIAEAQRASSAWMQGLGELYPESDAGFDIRVVPEPLARPLPLPAVPRVLPVISALMLTLATVVLLLACVNVANMLLARTASRERELAVRAALGAGRRRLVRQMLTESLLLAAAGTIAGLVLARIATTLFIASINIGADLPLHLDFDFDWRVFTYAFAAAVATGVVIGVWPALRASKADARAALHDGGRGQSAGIARMRIRRLLVIAQVAGSLVLLIVAGLFVRSLTRAQRIDLGFDPSHVLNARLDPRQIGYVPDRAHHFYDELERRVLTWPDVQAVSSSSGMAMSYFNYGRDVFIEGHAFLPTEHPPSVWFNRTTAGYFDTMSIPIVRGRAFTRADEDAEHRVAVINQVMAARFWPNEDPIGKRFRHGTSSAPLFEVVGVARDSKYLFVFEDPLPFFYVPQSQDSSSLRFVQVKTAGDPLALRVRLEREIHDLDPAMPIADLQTMNQTLQGGMGFLMFRTGAMQAGALGLLGLLLALIGVYSVIACGVSQRTREIGIRVALGADPVDVVRVILRQGITLVAAGIVVGLVAATVVSQILGRFLLLVSATDAVTFIEVSAGLCAVAFWACYLPARRATHVDPMVALRHE